MYTFPSRHRGTLGSITGDKYQATGVTQERAARKGCLGLGEYPIEARMRAARWAQRIGLQRPNLARDAGGLS
jgi:hypothetical protein